MKRQCLALLESWLPLFEEAGVGSLCLGARMKSELLHPQRLLSERSPDRDPGRRRPGSLSLPCRDRHARGWGPSPPPSAFCPPSRVPREMVSTLTLTARVLCRT